MNAKNVINGKFGEVWLDSDKIAECHKLQAKIDLVKEDVPICGKMGTAKKVVGWEGRGSMTLLKVNSRMAIKLAELVKNAKDARFTIVSKVADPDAYGAERVALKNVSFDDLTLADWENAKLGEVETPFTFEDYEFLDQINPQ